MNDKVRRTCTFSDASEIASRERIYRANEHSQNEPRYHALGKTEDLRVLHITFTLRLKGTLIRVISARDMHRKERTIYEQN